MSRNIFIGTSRSGKTHHIMSLLKKYFIDSNINKNNYVFIAVNPSWNIDEVIQNKFKDVKKLFKIVFADYSSQTSKAIKHEIKKATRKNKEVVLLFDDLALNTYLTRGKKENILNELSIIGSQQFVHIFAVFQSPVNCPKDLRRNSDVVYLFRVNGSDDLKTNKNDFFGMYDQTVFERVWNMVMVEPYSYIKIRKMKGGELIYFNKDKMFKPLELQLLD